MLASSSHHRPNAHETVADLRQQLVDWECAPRPTFPSGLKDLFPEGLRRGTLVEYLAASGSGAVALSLATAREACREGQAFLVVDRERRFFPQAASAWSLAEHAVLIRPATRKDELWAVHQALTCPGVGAVLWWPDKLEARAFRALQLAAEQGGAVGLLQRPPEARGRPTWSETQLLVNAAPSPRQRPRRLRVEVIRSRWGKPGSALMVEIDDEAGTLQAARDVSLAAELAAATPATSPGGA